MNVFYVLVLLTAMAVMQGMIGGTRLLFFLPALAILAVGAVVSLRDLRRPRVPPNFACLAVSALFFGYLIVRALLSPVAYLAWPDVFLILGSLAVYLLVACYLVDPRRRLWVLAGFLVFAGVNLAVGARQFATGSGYMLFGFLRSDTYLGRASGLYICPNHLAGYLEVVGSLALAAAFWSRLRPWVKILLGYGAICCFGGLLLTGSRGGFLSATAGLFTIAALGLWRSREGSPETFKRIVLLVVVLTVLAGVGVGLAAKTSQLIGRRAALLVYRKDPRTLLWPGTIKQFQSAPWLGTGAGTYLYYGRKLRDRTLQLDPIHAHCDYLELLAEYGLAGAAGLLLFLGAHIRWGIRAFRRLSLRFGSTSVTGGSNAAALNIGALAALVTIGVHSALDFNLHIPANALLMAFVFALLANPGRELAEGASSVLRLRPFDWVPRLALAAIGLVLLCWGVPKLPGEYHAEKARTALRDGRPMAALHQANLGIARERQNPFLYYYLGEARQTLADRTKNPELSRSFRESAIQPYKEGVKLFPSDTNLLLRLGQALTMTGNFSEAGRVMEEAVRWDPQSGHVQTYYGFYLQRAGRSAEAETAYRKALELKPNSTADEGLKQVLGAGAAAP